MLGEVPVWWLGMPSRALLEGSSRHRESHWFHKRWEVPAARPGCAQSTDGERRGCCPAAGMSPSWWLAAPQLCGRLQAVTPSQGWSPAKWEGGAHLVGCQQRLAEGFSPVDGEPGTGHLYPPGRETHGNGWGRAFWEEQAARKACSSPPGKGAEQAGNEVPTVPEPPCQGQPRPQCPATRHLCPLPVPWAQHPWGCVVPGPAQVTAGQMWRGRLPAGIGGPDRDGAPWGPRCGGLEWGQQHSRIHVRQESQFAGEDLRQQHSHKGPAQGTETRLQVLRGEKAPGGVRGAQTDALSKLPKPCPQPLPGHQTLCGSQLCSMATFPQWSQARHSDGYRSHGCGSRLALPSACLSLMK